MASDTFNPTLPSPSGPSNIISPVSVAKQPSDLQQIVGALPQLASVFTKVYKDSQERAAVEANGVVLGNAIADQRKLLEEQAALNAAQQDIITGQKEYQKTIKSANDGPLPLQRFEESLVKLQLAEQQGKLRPGYFNTQANKLFDEYRSSNPRLTKEFNDIFRLNTGGGSSSTTGTVDPAKLQFMDTVRLKYGQVTPENMQLEAKKQAPLMLAKQNKELGDLSFSNMYSGVMASVALDQDTGTSKAGQLFAKQGFLTDTQVQGFFAEAQQAKEDALNNMYKNVNLAQSRGEIISPTDIRQMKSDIEDSYKSYTEFFTNKDLTSRITSFNELKDAQYKAGFGDKLARAKDIVALGGEGMSNLLTNYMLTKNPSDAQVVKTLYGDLTGDQLSSLDEIKSVMEKAAYALSHEQVLPDYAGVQAYLSQQAIKSGKPVESSVVTAGVTAMDTLVKNPQDAVSSINSYNDVRFSANLAKNNPADVPTVMNNIKAYESIVRNEISNKIQADNGFTQLYKDPKTGAISVMTTERRVERLAGAPRSVTKVYNEVPIITNSTLKPITKQTTRGGLPTVIGYEDDLGNVWNVDREFTNNLQAVEKTYKNPSYKSYVEPYQDWFSGLQESFTFVKPAQGQ